MENLNNPSEEKQVERKEKSVLSLEGMEDKISTLMNHNDTPASEEFRQALKAKVLEAQAKNNMPRFSWIKNLTGLFKVRQFSVAVSVFLLVAVIGGVLLNGLLSGTNGKLSRVFINPAYAADDFSLVPLAADTAGVTPDSAYKLTSKESFSTDAIKMGLAFAPDLKATVKQVSDKEWIITPTDKLAANSLLKISLAATINDNGSLTPRDFSWAFQVKDNFRVLNSIPGNAGRNVPVNTGIEVTFSHPNLDSYEKYFSISPEVAGRFEYYSRTAVFVPTQPLASGELYTVTIGAGLGLTGSTEKLGVDYKFVFETAAAKISQQKWFGVNTEMLQFTPDENPYISVYGDTETQTSVRLYSFDSAVAFRTALDERGKYPAWSEKWNNYRYDTSKLGHVIDFAPKIETQNYVNLISFPTPLPAGFYLAEVAYQGKVASVLVEVNDINVIYNVDASKVLVWANRPSTGSAFAGADVSAGELVTGIKTDSRGVASFAVPAQYQVADYAKPIYLTVSSGQETSITQLSVGSPAVANNWTYFYTDRPRYQSDDTVRFWAMTRNRADATVVNGKYSVVLRKGGWYDYYYNPVKIAEVNITPDSFGTVTGEIPLKGLRPDSYEVALTLDGKDIVSRYVSVLPYVKPAYSISVTASQGSAFVGDNVKFTADAKFFDGTPAVGIALKVTKNSDGDLGKFTTDERGQITFSDTSNRALNASYTVAPQSSELGEISGYAAVRWYDSRFYTNVDVKYPTKGQAVFNFKVRKIDLNKINNQGSGEAWNWSEDWQGSDPASGAKVTADIYRDTYERVETGTAYDFISKTTYKTYRYDLHHDKVDSFSTVTGADGIVNRALALQPDTSYQMIYTVADLAGAIETGYAYAYYYDGNVYYRNYFGGGNDDQAQIEFNREDRTYSLGDKVKATLVSGGKPVASAPNNRFLFAKYQNGLKNWYVQDSSVYQFDFSAADIPNIQLFVAWWDGKNYHTSQTDGWWGNSTGGPKYNYADRRLTVSAVADKNSYKPGEIANLKLSVKDKNGLPVSASVNLNLVDEAYYAVASDSADPLASIYTPLSSGIVETRQTQLKSPMALASGAERGGCFAAGTLITMADGTSRPIEKVKIGDQVKTLANPLNKDVAIGTVGAVFSHVSNKLVSINKGLLTATPEHMIYASGTFKTAGEIRVGDELINLAGKKIAVTSTEIIFAKEPVYNLRVDPYHTFIANGVYVHNDKDGAVRQNFVDTALFRTVKTDANGMAVLSFQLPDNVTTWRLTTQAISGNLSAGISVAKIKATLPAFVDVSVGSEYLSGDQVVAKLRSFGVAMDSTTAVSYGVSAPALNNFSYQAQGKAYAPTEVNLPALPVGSFDFTYAMKSSAGNDTVKLPIKAVKSYLQAYKVLSATDVAVGTSFSAPGATDTVNVVFADASTMRFYQTLSSLGYAWGERVDQKLGHSLAADMMSKYYQETGYDNAFDGSLYQQADGGIGLLPYGSSDLDLTARLAALAPEKFDKVALRQYFLYTLNDRRATPETFTHALLGLASIGDPVLPQIQLWKMRTDLNVGSQMRVALALYKLGASEDARQIYNAVVKKAESRGDYYLLANEDANEALLDTAFLAELSAALAMPERDRLWAYVEDHKYGYVGAKIEVLTNLEDLAFVSYALPTLAPGPSVVSYELNGVKDEINLNGWGDKIVTLPAGDLPKLKITAVKGKVSAVVSANMPIEESGVIPSQELSITRSYSAVGGPITATTTEFKDGDIVRVNLSTSISRRSPANNYQVTDILPSGLVPVTSLYDPYRGHSYSWLSPYSIQGQRVSFNVWKDAQKTDTNGNYKADIFYYARVRTKGVYKAESAVIQAFKDPATINFSASQTVTVK